MRLDASNIICILFAMVETYETFEKQICITENYFNVTIENSRIFI